MGNGTDDTRDNKHMSFSLNIYIITYLTNPIMHSAPFCNRNVHTRAHFCYKMVHCGIWDWCIVGFVQQVSAEISTNRNRIACCQSSNRLRDSKIGSVLYRRQVMLTKIWNSKNLITLMRGKYICNFVSLLIRRRLLTRTDLWKNCPAWSVAYPVTTEYYRFVEIASEQWIRNNTLYWRNFSSRRLSRSHSCIIKLCDLWNIFRLKVVL